MANNQNQKIYIAGFDVFKDDEIDVGKMVSGDHHRLVPIEFVGPGEADLDPTQKTN